MLTPKKITKKINQVMTKSSSKKKRKSTKIFDLSKSYPQFKKYSLQDNLKLFKKDFGTDFKIRYNKKIIDAKLELKKLSNQTRFYRMSYDIPHRTNELTPFIIDFIDIYSGDKNNKSYINNIHKTNKLSGSEIVKICLEINRILGVQQVYLTDVSHILCNMDNRYFNLQFIKLLENKKSFYMKFGFDFDISNRDYLYHRFKDKKSFYLDFNKTIDKIKKIKISDLILECQEILNLLNQVVIENNKRELQITSLIDKTPEYEEIFKKNTFDNINDYYYYRMETLKKLNKYKHRKDFYKLLIYLQNHHCEDYNILKENIADWNIYRIKYGKKTITRDYLPSFLNFSRIINTHNMSYQFYN